MKQYQRRWIPAIAIVGYLCHGVHSWSCHLGEELQPSVLSRRELLHTTVGYVGGAALMVAVVPPALAVPDDTTAAIASPLPPVEVVVSGDAKKVR